mmetsp:Transcript_45145/g.75284  ORF Transcript_45145/g.75284 Transcript_45145/m.75284 type:complete len:436 (-) Transcript_45145:174-1481(-)
MFEEETPPPQRENGGKEIKSTTTERKEVKGISLEAVMKGVEKRFGSGDVAEQVRAAVEKLWATPPTSGLQYDDEPEMKLSSAREFFFAPNEAQLGRHVALLSLRQAGDVKTGKEIDFEGLDKPKKRLLIQTLAVAYHCYSDEHVIGLTAANGVSSLVELLNLKTLVFRFWSIQIMTRVMKMDFWNADDVVKTHPKCAKAVEKLPQSDFFLSNLKANIGGEFSGPCLQILAFVLEFNRRHYPKALLSKRAEIGATLKMWVERTQGKDNTEENNLAGKLFVDFARAMGATTNPISSDRQVESKDPSGEKILTAAEIEKQAGNEAFREKDFDTAIKCYSAAIQLDSKVPAYFSNRANARWKKAEMCNTNNMLRMQLLTLVVGDCEQALQLDGSYQKAMRRKGLALHAMGKREEAYKSLNKLQKTDEIVDRILKENSGT